MDLLINHSCPSCGGQVQMLEADRLTVCPWCDVQNYMIAGRMLRFVLPHAIPPRIDPESIIYFPYLRFKGNIYTCLGRTVRCRVLDTTHQGVEAPLLPPSLGLRPQALKISMVNEGLTGRFVKRRATPAEVLLHVEKLADSVIEPSSDPLHHRAFIGESVSCLYQPLYVENDVVHDGVLDREIGSVDAVGPWLNDPDLLMGFDRSWQPGYLAMVCPRCGDAMQGEPDSLVVHCFNCDSCWEESGGSFREVGYRAVDGGAGSVHLPFWRLRVEAEGIDMNSFGDLLTVANQPVVVRSEHRGRALEFWVPALKIRPKVFLTLARSATLSQLRFPEGGRELPINLQPVTLPEREAFQAIKPLFADLAVNKRDVMPMLPGLSFTLQESTLTFLPFTDTGHDYVQTHSGLSVASSVVRFGRKL